MNAHVIVTVLCAATQAVRLIGILAMLASVGCASFAPLNIEEVRFRDRMQTVERNGLRVSVSVPGAEETQRLFGVDLMDEGIQPVWLRIENHTERDYLFISSKMDPDYFTPNEAAWKSRLFMGGDENDKMAAYFESMEIGFAFSLGLDRAGFIFTNRDDGAKFISVMLLSDENIEFFDFVIKVPGIKTDYHQRDFDRLRAGIDREIDDQQALWAALEQMPCCTLGPDRETPGDPLNIVVIGRPDKWFFPFIRQGWHVTETLSGGSVWRTIQSSLFGIRYRTSPVSPLYLFDRPQDIALQKARDSVDERNHLRLWLAPIRYRGMDVWLGQISRDIGVRLSSKTLVTHQIDPDVDDARDGLAEDLLLSGSLAAYGQAPGVGAAGRQAPRYNYTGDPYYTDGLRGVYILSPHYLGYNHLKLLAPANRKGTKRDGF